MSLPSSPTLRVAFSATVPSGFLAVTSTVLPSGLSVAVTVRPRASTPSTFSPLASLSPALSASLSPVLSAFVPSPVLSLSPRPSCSAIFGSSCESHDGVPLPVPAPVPVPVLGVALDGVVLAPVVVGVVVPVVVGLVVVGLVVVGLVDVGDVADGLVDVGDVLDGDDVVGDPLPPPPPPLVAGDAVVGLVVVCVEVAVIVPNDGDGNADESIPFAAAGTVAYAVWIAVLAVAHALVNATRSAPSWFSKRILTSLSSTIVAVPIVSAPRTVIFRPLPQPMSKSFVVNSLSAAILAATAATTASGTAAAAVAVRSTTVAIGSLRFWCASRVVAAARPALSGHAACTLVRAVDWSVAACRAAVACCCSMTASPRSEARSMPRSLS